MSQEDAAIKMLSTPSPTASTSAGSSSASRRPPRKSTLTQQQKNQKRQRATQDQLVTLEMEFNKNPTPIAAVREKIADDINMTERSVQIWFQNRSVPHYVPNEHGTNLTLVAADVQRLSSWRRRALKPEKVAKSQKLCANTLQFKKWNQESR